MSTSPSTSTTINTMEAALSTAAALAAVAASSHVDVNPTTTPGIKMTLPTETTLSDIAPVLPVPPARPTSTKTARTTTTTIHTGQNVVPIAPSPGTLQQIQQHQRQQQHVHHPHVHPHAPSSAVMTSVAHAPTSYPIPVQHRGVATAPVPGVTNTNPLMATACSPWATAPISQPNTAATIVPYHSQAASRPMIRLQVLPTPPHHHHHHHQHSAGTIIPAAAAAPVQPKLNGAAIFSQMKLRRGKWTDQEEAYAEALISEFARGTVEGCENGSTLRAFLSKKLHCAPMRISKKYAGKGIGKQVFLSRKGPHVETSTYHKARLCELEMAFYKSLFQESEIAYMQGRFAAAAFGPGGPMLGMPHNSYPAAAPFFPQQAQMSWALQPATVASTARLTPPPRLSPAPIAPNPVTTTTTQPLVVPATTTTGSSMTAVHPPPSGATSAAHVPVPPSKPAVQHKHRSSVSDVPDFLSGFEKVAKKATTTATTTALVTKSGNVDSSSHHQSSSSASYSPPFTSRSFDDFHQFLGKGLSPRPLDLNNSNIRAGGNVTADSYVNFALESAQAVSQHSAYCRSSSSSSAQPTTTTGVVNNNNKTAVISLPSFSSSSAPHRPVIRQRAVVTTTMPTLASAPSVVSTANLKAHTMTTTAAMTNSNNNNKNNNIVSGSEKSSSDWGTEGSSCNGFGSSRTNSTSSSGSESNTAGSSDSDSEEGPRAKKKIKLDDDIAAV